MTLRPTEDQEIQAQIEKTTARLFSTSDIEARIADALLHRGEFQENISAADLEVILRNIVYVMFAKQKVAGRDIDILHNVPIMNIEIDNEEAFVDFVVHIHKPIIVFLEFKYSLINQEEDGCQSLCLREGSLRIKEKTRRFDVKAKAALTAMNVPKIARNEMSDLTNVIRRTLPNQLQKKGVEGELRDIRLFLNEHTLNVYLKGEFEPR
ncbi:MAG: hypothetical protein R3293_11305 [Candidatus Promineifilaceae bacterium]|nr:hypothetical protein [Candidatus Promineifilaceae bacterium]